jgi:hypothetical protein
MPVETVKYEGNVKGALHALWAWRSGEVSTGEVKYPNVRIVVIEESKFHREDECPLNEKT